MNPPSSTLERPPVPRAPRSPNVEPPPVQTPVASTPATPLPNVEPRQGVPATGWAWQAVQGPILSLATHIVVILCVAHWWLPQEVRLPQSLVVLPADEVPEDVPSIQMEAADIAIDHATAASQRSTQLKPVAVAMDRELVDQLALPGPVRPITEVALLVSGLGQGGQGGGMFGGGEGEGKGVGEDGAGERGDYGANFFGIRAGGRRFVFVMDSSRSMSGRRWVQACQELLQTVGELNEEQSFYVIFFDSTARPMFTNRIQKDLLPATDDNRTKLRRWMSSIALGSDTFPAGAVQMALKLKPDAIFLLSDGEFNDATARLLRATNHRRDENGDFQVVTPVHAIGFHSRVSQASLKPLADENGGAYRFVPNPRDRQMTRVRP